MIRLSLVSVGMVEETAGVILVLRAPELERLLVMEVGLLEGRAVAMEAEGVKAPRPLTHDLLLQVIESLGASVAEVQIREFRDKTFFANLVLAQPDGTRLELDARPSDAIAVALRAGAPIFATEEVIASAGMEEDEESDAEDAEDDIELDEDEEDEENEEHTVH
jgi:bifunctional DNase/RNase